MTTNRNLLVLLVLGGSFALVVISAFLLSAYFERTYSQYQKSIAALEQERESLSKKLQALETEHSSVQAAYAKLTQDSVKICMADLRSTSDESCQQVAKDILSDARPLDDIARETYFQTIGVRYWRQKLFVSASGWFEEALKINADSENANVFLGYSLFRSAAETTPGKRTPLLEKALAATDRALKVHPGNSYAIINRLKILCALGRNKEARTLYDSLRSGAIANASEATKAIAADGELKRTCRAALRH